MLLTHVSGQECESRYHQFSLITHSNPSSSSRRNTYDFTCLSLTILQLTLSRGLSSVSSPVALQYWGGRQVINPPSPTHLSTNASCLTGFPRGHPPHGRVSTKKRGRDEANLFLTKFPEKTQAGSLLDLLFPIFMG